MSGHQHHGSYGQRVRVAPDGQATVATPAYEDRNIFVVEGLQFHYADRPEPDAGSPDYDARLYRCAHYSIAAYLNHPTIQTELQQSGTVPVVRNINPTQYPITAEYTNHTQRIHYHININIGKHDFLRALGTPNAIVIYSGHARYGRGPCFSQREQLTHWSSAGNDWQDSDTPTTSGILRAGYPFLSVPISSVYEHGYQLDLVPMSTAIDDDDCEPDLRSYLRRHRGRVTGMTLSEIEAGVAAAEAAGSLHLHERHLPPPPFRQFLRTPAAPSQRYWAYMDDNTWYPRPSDPAPPRFRQPWVVLAAGYGGFVPNPIRCRVFCNFSCDSHKHFASVLRRRIGWARTGDTNFAFFNSAVARNCGGPSWLHGLLTYPRVVAGQPWAPHLRAAKRTGNRVLSQLREGFRIVEG